MGKARKVKQAPITRHSAILGLVSDLLFLVGLLIKAIGWPIHALAHVLKDVARKYPRLKFLHSHEVWSVLIGLAVLTVATMLEHYSQHFLWATSIETLRAVGVVPIWEQVSAKLVRA